MEKILFSLGALVCISAVVVAQGPGPRLPRPPRPFPPHPTPACYGDMLMKDSNPDLSFVCNDQSQYPDQEIEEALHYAEDHWRFYLNLTTTCFKDKDNFFMNEFAQKDFYRLKCVCKTRRNQIFSIYNAEGLRCHVVRPDVQKIYFAECGGTCNLGYDGVTGYHCIPRGYTYRKFMAYCHYPKDLPATTTVTCNDPVNGPLNPRDLPPSTRMTTMPLPSGQTYKRLGFFTEVAQTMPTYCGCRGYFCGF